MSERRFWSVTTLIKEALGTGRGLVEHNKSVVAGISYDRRKMLAQFVEDDDRDGWIDWALSKYWDAHGEALARGTEIHRAAEAINLGATPIALSPANVPLVEQYQRFLADFEPEFLMAEAPVYNLELGYAGTLDAIARIQGSTVLLDMKTTLHGPNAVDKRGRPKRRPPFSEVPLQLAFYRRAPLVGILADRREIQYRRYYVFDPELQHTEPMPDTDGAACLVISPEDYLLVPVKTGDAVWNVCRAMLPVANYQIRGYQAAIGQPIAPTRGVVHVADH